MILYFTLLLIPFSIMALIVENAPEINDII